MHQTIKKNANWFLYPFLVLLISGPEFATDMYIPSLPSVVDMFHSTKAIVAMTITAFLLGQAIFQLFYGAFSDRFGRKPAILIGYGICFIGSLVCVFSMNLPMFFIGRILQGAGAAAGVSMTLAIARDSFEGDKMASVFSVVMTVYFATFAGAPIVGGYFEHYIGWQSTFIFLAAYCVMVFLLTLFGYRETHTRLDVCERLTVGQMIKNYGTIISSKVFICMMLTATFGYASLYAYAAITPFLFQKVLHFTAVEYGWMSVFTAVGFVISSLSNALLIKKFGTKLTIMFGLLFLLISSVVMLILGYVGLLNLWVIMAPFFAFSFGSTILSICCASGAMSPFGHIAGSAGALFGSLQFFVLFAMSLVFAHLGADTQVPFAWTLVVLAVLSIIMISYDRMTTKTGDDVSSEVTTAH